MKIVNYMVLIILLLGGCSSTRSIESEIKAEDIDDLESVSETVHKELVYTQEKTYEPSYKIYATHMQIDDEDIIISYPQIYGDDDLDRQSIINDLILEDATSIMDQYSNENLEEFWLDIYFEVTLSNNDYMSIQFFGFAEGEDYPHWHKINYTSNIDLKKGIRLDIEDIVELDDRFLLYFANEFQYVGPLSDEEAMAYVSEKYKDVALLSDIFMVDDGMTMSKTYFYLTKDSLGISFSESHSAGGYAKFEAKYLSIDSKLN